MIYVIFTVCSLFCTATHIGPFDSLQSCHEYAQDIVDQYADEIEVNYECIDFSEPQGETV